VGICVIVAIKIGAGVGIHTGFEIVFLGMEF